MELYDIKDELMQVAHGELDKADLTDSPAEMTEWIFANEKNPALVQMFHSFYKGAFANKIGLAHCRDKETGKLVTVLVGVHTADGVNQLFPLAKVLDESEMNKYEAPDGNGGYITSGE